MVNHLGHRARSMVSMDYRRRVDRYRANESFAEAVHRRLRHASTKSQRERGRNPSNRSISLRPSNSTPPDMDLAQRRSSDTPCCPPPVPADCEGPHACSHIGERDESHTSAASQAPTWPVG
jgi:hypothetical protein